MHVVYRFDTGGLENGVVNLINHMPAPAYRHAVVALTEVTGLLRSASSATTCVHLAAQAAGHGWQATRHVALCPRPAPGGRAHAQPGRAGMQVPAWAARRARPRARRARPRRRRPGRQQPRLQRVRRLYRPFVHHYVALSRDLAGYLRQGRHQPPRMTQIYNGVDTDRFQAPVAGPPARRLPLRPRLHWLVGTVGRMQTVKDQTCWPGPSCGTGAGAGLRDACAW
jgi:hypothetical protein